MDPNSVLPDGYGRTFRQRWLYRIEDVEQQGGQLGTIQSLDSYPDHRRTARLLHSQNRVEICIERYDYAIVLDCILQNLAIGCA